MRRLSRGLAPLVLAGLAACAQLEPRPDLPVETAIPAGEGSEVDRLIAPAEARHPGESAFRLLNEGPEAFVIRARSARLAGRSLDVQTYIWHGDLTGAYLAQRLLEAADRGVKVRLLVDDMDARAKNAGFAALAAHPNIAVRMFNPFASRKGTMSMVGEGLTSFGRINHRMHNKTWIADNRIAIVGGRNLGDEYFGASDEVNFVDLDFAMIGPIVRDASASFDKYWNSPAAYPMEVLDPAGVSAAALERLRGRLAERARRRQRRAATRTSCAPTMPCSAWWRVTGPWTGPASITSPPTTRSRRRCPSTTPARSVVRRSCVPMVQSMQTELTVISPYFVPGEEVTASWVKSVEGRQARARAHELADRQRRGGGARRLRTLSRAAGRGRRAGLGAEAAGGQRRAVEPVRLLGREPAHQGARGRRPDALRRQLQPRPALDLAQLRAGCDRREPGARAAARGDLRRADRGHSAPGR